MVTYCATKLTVTCSPMIGQFFDTMILVSTNIKLKLRMFLAGHSCYGNLLCHKIDSDLFTNDWAVF